MLTGSDKLALFLRSKYLTKDGELLSYYKHSSRWNGLKWVVEQVKPKMKWVVGNGKKVDLYHDNWLGESIQSRLALSKAQLKNCRFKVSVIIQGNTWVTPEELQWILNATGLSLGSELPNAAEDDIFVCCPDIKGRFSVSTAHEAIRVTRLVVEWHQFVWNNSVRPRLEANAWKICSNIVSTDENVQKRGVSLVSCCSLCLGAKESVSHPLRYCETSRNLWTWVTEQFMVTFDFDTVRQTRLKMKNQSPLTKTMWNSAILGCMVSEWRFRNRIRFENDTGDVEVCKQVIKSHVLKSVPLSKTVSRNSVSDLVIYKTWNVKMRPPSAPNIKEYYWKLPPAGMMKINVDVASMCNPGNAGWGAIFRDETGQVKLLVCKGLGVCTSYQAECFNILLEMALERGWTEIRMKSDSEAAVKTFQTNDVPWCMLARWKQYKRQVTNLEIAAIWRECNFGADQAAKQGA